MSNVTAYEKMRRERDDALNQVAEERQKTFMAKKIFGEEVKRINTKILNMKRKVQFWQMISIGVLAAGIMIGCML